MSLSPTGKATSLPTPGKASERILILGGTAEGRELAARLVASGHSVTSSLAGRTSDPLIPPGDVRVGGFGGSDGLLRYLKDNGIDRVIDATHPFAGRISENARIACRHAGVPLEVIDRPVWAPEQGDRWEMVKTLADAADALPLQARVFLALGRQYLKAFETLRERHFVIRMVDPPAVPLAFRSFELVLGKPDPDPAVEAALFARHAITHLVCRNSGGTSGYAKIVAARRLGLPVLMIDRPTA